MEKAIRVDIETVVETFTAQELCTALLEKAWADDIAEALAKACSTGEDEERLSKWCAEYLKR